MFHKKSLGQHFLHSKAALAKIVEAAHLSSDDTVLEVGPGEGVLTELLLQKAGRVIAVEKDDRLVPVLAQRFQNEIAAGKLELIHADILEFPISNFPACAEAASAGRQFPKKSYKLVANIPYYITGALIRKFLESETQPSTMVLLLQKEVAKRIVAGDGKESILSISVKAYGTPKYIDTVKAGAFSPPPNVDSAIIAIEHISKEFFNTPFCHPRECGDPGVTGKNLDSRAPLPEGSSRRVRGGSVGNDNEARFFALLKKGFAHPRKLLSSNLGIPAEKLRECGIAEKARPENLQLKDWESLAKLYRA